MTDGQLKVGESEPHQAFLWLREAGVSRPFDDNDGYGTLYFWIERGSGPEYLDAPNMLSVSATPQDHGLTWNGALGDDGKWDDGIDWVVPNIGSLFGVQKLYFEKTLRWTDDDSVAKKWSGSWTVNVTDLDEIEEQVVDPVTEGDRLDFTL